jgi:predicted transcriptional regulator
MDTMLHHSCDSTYVAKTYEVKSMEECLIFSQYARNFATKTLVARPFVVDTMEDKFSLPIQDVLISSMNNLSYHFIQDGVDQRISLILVLKKIHR